MHATKWKKSIWKGYMWLYVSNYRTFWKRQNYEESKKISGCQGLVGKDKQVEHRAFLGRGNYFL